MEDHPLRYTLANELHARPFPTLEAPCGAIYLAIKRAEDAAGRDREADRLHLTQLLDRHGAPHPQPGATHWFGELGKYKLKWEQHTEFVTYTLFKPFVEDRPFDAKAFDAFPPGWLADAPGARITSALIRVENETPKPRIKELIEEWFVPESLAVSTVLDGAATIAGDFRIDAGGHMRFAVFAQDTTGERRVGRIVQRLCEIETYKSMSMLGLARAREMGPRMGELDQTLTGLMSNMTGKGAAAEDTLAALLATSAELENLLAQSSFRFGATGAYEAIVNQRIDVLREERFNGRQTFGEFMMRRFDPAMRTVKASERRLQTMAERAIRAGDLLRTRVDVERSAQNQTLLESMDQRAALQLRLQKTVEGLSVVAISYYAVNLVLYMVGPFGDTMGLTKLVTTALVTPLVILLVWWMVRRIRKKME
ncbi:putative membrane-anchored protein [Litoreibacter ponti]|uniref:Putative membrane-anchored protein n=1 Tax=Litoreibacter ponti TaxID=1510457 RepID=A0A2T6BKK3_9RHOB|nr:putative membrane-anchored protein [Litoreibacter ponti]